MTDIRGALQPGAEMNEGPALRRGDNKPQPICSLRDWLDHLAARGRLTILEPGAGLRFELAVAAAWGGNLETIRQCGASA